MTGTVAEPLRRAACGHRRCPPFLVEGPEGWRPVMWDAVGARVEEIAAGLLSLGIAPGDRVAILGRTRLEWALTDFALIAVGAVVVPVYASAAPADRAHVLAHSGARALVCEDPAQRERVARLPGLGRLEHLLTMEPSDLDLDALAERGRGLLRRDEGAVSRARAAIGADDLMSLVYTSGTTGPPKGCRLTHRNHRAMIDAVVAIDGLVRPGDVALLHLPLAHVFARLVELLPAAVDMTVALCPDPSRLGSALAAVRPTLVPSVPRVFETMHAAALREAKRGPWVRRRLVGAALRAGRKAADRRREGRPLGPWLRLRRRAADRLVLSRIRSRLGGRLRLAVSGGAKLAPETAHLFESIGVPMLEGYGLTECTTVAAVNRPDRRRIGTVGPPVPGVEVRIARDGEILVRGETVFDGYHRDDAATREALDDEGWLRTGDLGSLDADGFLTVTDRATDVIVTSGGENVAPQRVETALRASPLIAEALVVGHGRPFLVALIVPATRDAPAAAGDDAELLRRVRRAVTDVNRAAPHAERVRRIAVLPRGLRVEAGELTPTLKPRRRVCEAHFADLIEGLYAGARKPEEATPTGGRGTPAGEDAAGGP